MGSLKRQTHGALSPYLTETRILFEGTAFLVVYKSKNKGSPCSVPLLDGFKRKPTGKPGSVHLLGGVRGKPKKGSPCSVPFLGGFQPPGKNTLF